MSATRKKKKSPHVLMFGVRVRATDEERVLVARKDEGNTHALALRVGGRVQGDQADDPPYP
jgi:hypothetical protein